MYLVTLYHWWNPTCQQPLPCTFTSLPWGWPQPQGRLHWPHCACVVVLNYSPKTVRDPDSYLHAVRHSESLFRHLRSPGKTSAQFSATCWFPNCSQSEEGPQKTLLARARARAVEDRYLRGVLTCVARSRTSSSHFLPFHNHLRLTMSHAGAQKVN